MSYYGGFLEENAQKRPQLILSLARSSQQAPIRGGFFII
jgi:hypothetical protein